MCANCHNAKSYYGGCWNDHEPLLVTKENALKLAGKKPKLKRDSYVA